MTMTKRLVSVVCLSLTMGLSAPTYAQEPSEIATASAVFVERVESPTSGRRLEPAKHLSRGDRVVTVVTWQRKRGDGSFVITNPLPPRLAYQRSASDIEEVSVDGGKTWGHLQNLRVKRRNATSDDVTNVRWRIPATHAALGRGQIAFAGIVR